METKAKSRLELENRAARCRGAASAPFAAPSFDCLHPFKQQGRQDGLVRSRKHRISSRRGRLIQAFGPPSGAAAILQAHAGCDSERFTAEQGRIIRAIGPCGYWRFWSYGVVAVLVSGSMSSVHGGLLRQEPKGHGRRWDNSGAPRGERPGRHGVHR
jgi:hypothetical protein